MNAQTFLDSFTTVAEAPGGVERLRDLVLNLAVSGRLSSQVSSDEPAERLLAGIAADKLVAESNLTEPVSAGDEPWGLPHTWRWARLKSICDFAAGRTPPTKDATFWAQSGGHAWVSIGDMPDGGEVTATKRRVTSKAVADIFGHDPDPPGTILMSFKLTIGKVARLAVPAFHNEAIISIAAPFDVMGEYLFRTLPRLTQGGSSKAAIMGDTLNKTSLTNLLVPVPPLAEQERIVAKVDELMRLCDELEARQECRHRATIRFRGSALHALCEAEAPNEVRLAWQRVESNWPAITAAGESVRDLRQTVLQLAFEGKLNGVGADTRSLPATTPGRVTLDRPFPIPGHWRWTRFDEVVDSRLGKMLDKAKNTGPMRPYIRNANVQWFRFDLADVHELRLEDDELETHSVRTGDLVICEGGEPGRLAVCDDAVSGMVFQKALHRARPHRDVSVWYLAYLLRCYAGSGYLSTYFTGATIKHLTGKALGTVPVPMPPITEQHQIVARIEHLSAACDQLERTLSHEAASQRALAASLTRIA